MPEKDVRDYFQTLAGHEGSPPVPEAQLLRRVILEDAAQQAPPLLEAEAKDRFKRRLEQAGVLKPPRGKRAPWHKWLVPAFMAALLVLALNPSALLQMGTGDVVSTGATAKAMPLVIHTRTPTEQAQTFQVLYDKLSTLSPQPYEVGNTKVLDVLLPQPVPQEVVEVVHQYGLHLPPPPADTSFLRPWVQHLLQRVGLVSRPTQPIQIEVTRPAGG